MPDMICLTFLSKFLGRFLCFFYENRGPQTLFDNWEKISPCFGNFFWNYTKELYNVFVFFQAIFILEKYFLFNQDVFASVNSEIFQLIELSSNFADSIFLRTANFFYLEYNFQSDVFSPSVPTEIYTNKK